MTDTASASKAPVPSDAPPPKRHAAMARIAGIRPVAYARTRNHLDGAVTGLSPYLTHGLVTLREVLAEVVRHQRLDVRHKFAFELGWREFFRHVWARHGDGILWSLHPGPRPDESYDPVLPDDIWQGRTGVPAIDEAVRTLYATGTLHNHARMWLASYVVHLRHVHWRAGADWMVAHLLDGDLASNHLSWQWVAGTGSHKPYLFNADNVAKFAPSRWHSPGSTIDRSYEALDAIARGPHPVASEPDGVAIDEPPLLVEPPADLGLQSPEVAEQVADREVWLVHPWALRAPPAGLPEDVVIIGVYSREYHRARPWTETRWRWVDEAMAAVTPIRRFVDEAGLARVLAGAARVRSVEDPHLTEWLGRAARLDAAPALFPSVDHPCDSFSQWWSRTTRGLNRAEELL